MSPPFSWILVKLDPSEVPPFHHCKLDLKLYVDLELSTIISLEGLFLLLVDLYQVFHLYTSRIKYL